MRRSSGSKPIGSSHSTYDNPYNDDSDDLIDGLKKQFFKRKNLSGILIFFQKGPGPLDGRQKQRLDRGQCERRRRLQFVGLLSVLQLQKVVQAEAGPGRVGPDRALRGSADHLRATHDQTQPPAIFSRS